MAEQSDIHRNESEVMRQNEDDVSDGNTTREDQEHARMNNDESQSTSGITSKENTPVHEGMRETAPSPTETSTTDTVQQQPTSTMGNGPTAESSHDSFDASKQGPHKTTTPPLVSTYDFSASASQPRKSIFGDGSGLNPEVTIVGSKTRKNQTDDHRTESKRIKTSRGSEGPSRLENSTPPKEIAAMVVGPQQSIILCEKHTLMQHSKYFNDCFGRGFSEGDTSATVFPEERPDTVTAYVTWAYSECSQLPGGDGPLQSPVSLYLYCFAEQIQCIKLKNQLIEQLYGFMKKQFLNQRGEKNLGQIKAYLTPNAINHAMNHLPLDSSPLLKLLAYFFNMCLSPEKLKDWHPVEQYPPSFRLLAYQIFFCSGGYTVKPKFPRICDLLEQL